MYGDGTGGGVLVDNSQLLLYRAMVQNNRALGGGGVYVMDEAAVGVIGSTIAGNAAIGDVDDPNGGGVWVASGGELNVVNSTISGNTAWGSGGGIYSEGTTSLYSSTVAGNIADEDAFGGGDGGGLARVSQTLTLRNTLVGDNIDRGSQAPDCYPQVQTAGYNLVESLDGCVLQGANTGNVTGQDPRLYKLSDLGGSTLTQGLLPDSPALDAGSPGRCTEGSGIPLFKDQRGWLRERAQRCDIGAFEGAVSLAYLPLMLK